MYLKVTFFTSDKSKQEQIIAGLQAEEDVTGFEELEEALIAYAMEDADPVLFTRLAEAMNVSVSLDQLDAINWNQHWEENFEPVIIDQFCYIRADFHPGRKDVQYEIVITPKMSFGTGHHATTQMMIELMRDIDFKEKTVFDFGTGTGVLAILAGMRGAGKVLAIDNDIWSYENALENCGRNASLQVKVMQGSIDLAKENVYDIILANINRNILLDHMQEMKDLLTPGGVLLMSGILAEEDVEVIQQRGAAVGLKCETVISKDKWAAMRCSG